MGTHPPPTSSPLYASADPICAAKRRRLDVEEQLVVAGVQRGEVTEARLAAKLSEHVEQIDVDMVRCLGLLLWVSGGTGVGLPWRIALSCPQLASCLCLASCYVLCQT